MKPKKFNLNDKVFAKVKGYPAWPAIITCVNKSTYSVLFYGTGEVAACKPQDLYYYIKYKHKFVKNQKRKDFFDAVKEINEAIEEAGGTDGSTDDLSTSVVNNSESSCNETIDNSRKNSEEAPIVPSKRTYSTPEAKRRKVQHTVSNASDEEVDDVSVHENSPLRECVSETEPSIPDEVEAVGIRQFERRGPKLAINDIKVITVDYMSTVIAYAKHVRQNPEIYKNKPMEPRPKTGNELVLTKTPSGDLIGIKYNRDEEIKYETEYERAEYDEKEASILLSMKNLIESGKCMPEEDYMLFETNLEITDAEIEEAVELASIESKKEKLQWLKVESRLAQLDTEVKKHLGLEKANPQEAIKSLKAMLALEVEPLMLIKHPPIFQMAKRLRRYIGNVYKWNYTEEECKKFENLAEQVRDAANAVYEKFVALFKRSNEEDCWTYYEEQVAHFKEQVRDMLECKVFALTAHPTSRIAFFDNMEDEEELQLMVEKLGKNTMTATVHLQM